MARLREHGRGATGHRVAVVDDDENLLRSTVRLLEQEGHEVRSATTPAEGIELVRTWRPHLLLLDYYMVGGTGADVVRAIRQFDDEVQVLLVTGYASEQPARRLLAELDIQGYHDKTDGPQRLLLLVDAGLKHYRALLRMVRQRGYLRHILTVAPAISQLQPARELLRISLEHVGGLLEGSDGVIATANSGLFVIDEPTRGISVHAGIGRYSDAADAAELPTVLAEVVRDGLSRDQPFADDRGFVVIPLTTRGGDRGCMVVEADGLPEDAVDPCELYGRQVVQALENVVLYEQATTDPLTALHNRGYGTQRLDEVLRLGSRLNVPTSLIMIDVDHFKAVNDERGHVAGDVALRSIARSLRSACRASDVLCRWGGEELLMILPATDEEGAMTLAERLRRRLEEHAIDFEGARFRVTASFGVASVEGRSGPMELLQRADGALYAAKRQGRNRVALAGPAQGRLDAPAAI